MKGETNNNSNSGLHPDALNAVKMAQESLNKTVYTNPQEEADATLNAEQKHALHTLQDVITHHVRHEIVRNKMNNCASTQALENKHLDDDLYKGILEFATEVLKKAGEHTKEKGNPEQEKKEEKDKSKGFLDEAKEFLNEIKNVIKKEGTGAIMSAIVEGIKNPEIVKSFVGMATDFVGGLVQSGQEVVQMLGDVGKGGMKI